MGNSFRNQPGPALYPAMATPVTDDLLEIGLAFAIGIIAFSFLIIVPGIRGWERLWATVRVLSALFIGAALLESNFGLEWYAAERCVRTQYKAYVFPAGIRQEIEASVGIHIGLRGVNITLTEESLSECLGSEAEGESEYESPFPDERIRYNEEFGWSEPWAQGRLGFGRFAGEINQEFRAAQFRGTPYPILFIAEYFTLDGEQIRWGRKFRLGGWYGHILLWTAFATYLLSILLFIFVIRLGAWFMVITGLLMILAAFSYAIIIINDPRIAIPFANPREQITGVLKPDYGWSFYLALIVGIVVVLVGALIIVLDYFVPRKIAVVFHHSILEEDEFFAVDEEDEEGKPSLEEYGVATRGIRRGETARATRAGRTTTRRGLSRYRQTQRKPRSTIRSSAGGGGAGTQRLHDDIQLEELPAKE